MSSFSSCTGATADCSSGGALHDHHLELAVASKREAALVRLFDDDYVTLKQIARTKLRGYRANDGLEPCSLVHECYLRMLMQVDALRGDRAAMLAYAVRTMQSIVIDQLRYHASSRRGGASVTVAFDDDGCDISLNAADTDVYSDIDVRRALDQLTTRDPRAAHAAALHFIADAPLPEIACELGVVVRTVTRDCARARDRLRKSLMPMAA